MDNLPKDNNQDKHTSGEIFSDNTSSSPYQEATSIAEEISTPQTPPGEDIQGPEFDNNSNKDSNFSETPQDGGIVPPPPYTEDNRKKYLLIGVIAVFLVLLAVLILSAVLKKKPKAQEKITINYWGLWEDTQLMQPLFDEYNKTHPNITVNYVKQDPKQYRERLQAAIDRGDGPDIFRFHNTWVPMLMNHLAPMPKSIYSDEDYKKIFYPVVTSDLKVGGNYFGLPLEIDGLVLFYNEDILKSTNVSVPSTWEDVKNSVPKLTVKEKGRIVTSAIALGTAENIEHFSDILGLMLLQNGTKLTSSLNSCADSTSTTCSSEVMTFYRQFAETPNNTWDESLENSITAFATGKVAMIIAPSWQAYTIKEISKNSSLNFKVAQVPQLPCPKSPASCVSVNWASYWVEGVSSKSKNTVVSWDLLKFLTQADTLQKLYEAQIKYRKLFGEPYSRVDLGKNLSDNPYIAPIISEASTMKSFYLASRTNDGETGINTSFIKYLQDAVNSLTQGVSVETAIQTADKGFKQVFDRYKISASNP